MTGFRSEACLTGPAARTERTWISTPEALKIRSGRLVKHSLVPEKKRIALILAGVCLCLLIGQLLSRKLKKKIGQAGKSRGL